MTPAEAKITENRLRRIAERRGMQLRKSRRRDPQALDYGQYWLIDTSTSSTGHLVLGGEWGAELDEIREYLEGGPEQPGDRRADSDAPATTQRPTARPAAQEPPEDQR